MIVDGLQDALWVIMSILAAVACVVAFRRRQKQMATYSSEGEEEDAAGVPENKEPDEY